MKKSKHLIEESGECQQPCQTSDFMNATMEKAREDKNFASNTLAFGLVLKSLGQDIRRTDHLGFAQFYINRTIYNYLQSTYSTYTGEIKTCSYLT